MTLDEAQRRASRVTAPCAAIGVACACAPALFERYAWARDLWLVRGTGWAALVALALSLCATPAGRLVERLAPARAAPQRFAAYRRALGLSAAAIGALHFALALATYLRGARGAVLEYPFLRSGLLALAVLLVLALTSFPAITRAARVRLWKHLHRLAYAAALLALHHALLSPFAPRGAVLAVFGAIVALGMLRLLPAGDA
jgi:sulfoxide reductase heme-binding subunit YedZ